MKKIRYSLFILSILALAGCSSSQNTSWLIAGSEQTITITGSAYIVKTQNVTDGNGQQIDMYSGDTLVFSKSAEGGLWSFQTLVDNIVFIDYWTAVGGRQIKLFDVNNKWKLVFETRYNGSVNIMGDSMYFNFWFYPDPKWVTCDNYEELQKMWWSVNYEQRRAYNFKTKTLRYIWGIYCAYGE